MGLNQECRWSASSSGPSSASACCCAAVNSFHQSVEYSRGRICNISAQPVSELLSRFDILDCNGERQVVLHHNCHEGVVDGCHHLNRQASLHRSQTLHCIYDQTRVSYISNEDKRLLLAHQTITLNPHNNSVSEVRRRQLRIIGHVQSVMNYTGTSKLENNAQFFKAQTPDIPNYK